MPDEIKIRPSARVLLLDADDRVFMFRIHDPSATQGPNPITADFWLLPGGGVEPGETYEQAALREVFEETGLTDVELGPCLWTQDKIVGSPTGEPWHVIAKFFLGRTGRNPEISYAGHEPLEASTITGHEWFTRAEIQDRERTETVLPPGLGTLLGEVLPG